MDAFDVVINCVNKPGTELMTLLAVKQKGASFLPPWAAIINYPH